MKIMQPFFEKGVLFDNKKWFSESYLLTWTQLKLNNQSVLAFPYFHSALGKLTILTNTLY